MSGGLTVEERGTLAEAASLWAVADPGVSAADAWCGVESAVERILAAHREPLAERVKALADEWTHATCQTDGAPCSWHRVSAECADELTALLDPSETP